MYVEDSYAGLISACLEGEKVMTRNSECYRSVCRRHEFTSTPLVCTRRTAWKNCLLEWEWFMKGSPWLADLHPSVRHWWEPFAREGWLPHNYGRQFRYFGEMGSDFDQIQYLVESIKQHPHSRRAVITTWHTAQMASGVCNPTNCHGTVIQAFVENGALTLYTYQRSADVVVGVPHNWLQYWAFLLWLGHVTKRKVGRLIWEGGDCHVYAAHKELAERIVRAHKDCKDTPSLSYSPTSDDFRAADFSLTGPYVPLITDRAEMIV